MRNSVKRLLWIGGLVIVTATQGMCAEEVASQNDSEEMKKLRLIKEAYLKMDKFYYQDVSKRDVGNLFYRCQFIMMSLLKNLDENYLKNLDKLTYSTINMIVEAMKDPSDKYSKFIHKDYLKRVIRESIKSKFAGIGIEVEKKDALFFIAKVYEDSSAFEEGILKGDELLAVGGESVAGWELDQIDAELKIPQGETVQLTLLHPEETVPFEVTLICRIIRVPSVASEYYDEQQIAYIRINKFRDLTADEFQVALDELLLNEFKGLIIDLRDNSGGDETQVIKLSDMFLAKDSVIVYFIKRDAGRQEERTTAEPLDFPYPIVILVNEKTGSSAEIFAGTMQHYGKAFIVGEQTGGKGSLKNTVALSDGSALFLITSRTYLPNGATFDQEGITPDFVVHGKEAQLEKAFDIIEGKASVEVL